MPKISSKAQNLILCLTSFLLALFLFEGVLRIMAGRLGLESQEVFYEQDPLLGWRHVAGKKGIFRTNEYAIEESFNSQGVRGPEYPYKKDSQEFRILVLGDSFAEGYSVSFENLFSELFKAKLNQGGKEPYQVINLGTAGYSTDQELLLFENEGKKYWPDLTVILFYENDVWFNTQSHYWRGRKPYFLLKEGRLILVDLAASRKAEFVNFQNISRSIKSWIRNFYLYNFINRVVENSPFFYHLALRSGLKKFPNEFRVWKKNPDADFREAWNLTEALLLRLKDSAKKAGSRLIVFYVPAQTSIDEQIWQDAKIKYNISDKEWSPNTTGVELAAICKENGIPFVNPQDDFLRKSEEFKSQGKRLYFRYDGHWNKDGHALVADVLYSYVQGQGL